MPPWEAFRAKSTHYENQIQAYVSYLESGQRLLQQLIDRAQGIISVDSLQHSHRLELVVVSVASMLEATAISAKVNHHFTDLIHCEVHGVMGHYINIALHFFAVGLPLGIFAGLVVFLLQKYRH
ncbi:MAG: hypothetical protein BWK79_17645 [Beggiatoa sp. IS2]|nr:MAG: hypothetical protein BWK79_17645 [Beggiatoa sp. IS2]